MRFIKMTQFREHEPAIVTITDEDSLNEDIYTVAIHMRSHMVGFRSDIEIFESDKSLEQVLIEHSEPAERPQDVKNLDILCFSYIATLMKAEPVDTIVAAQCPLDRVEVTKALLERVCTHPAYRGQLLQTTDKNGEKVSVYVGGNHGNQHGTPDAVRDRTKD